MRRHDEHGDGSAAIGCAIQLFGGCACIGGLLFFMRVVYDMLCSFLLK